MFLPVYGSLMLCGTLLSLMLLLPFTAGHARWKCPLPRDEKDENGKHIRFDNTGNKVGACGPQSGNWGFGTVAKVSPGWNTFVWEESISHEGSPFRLAILDEKEEAKVVLLDHIPHWNGAKPTANVEKTYVEYKMSVNIPDVNCTQCSLQLLYVMTDKSTKCGIKTCYYNPDDSACKGSTDPDAETCYGAPNDDVCEQENECYSNYHTCTDVTISGTQPLSNFAYNSQPTDWPYKDMQMQYYSLEAAQWSNGWLEGIPPEYTTEYTNFC